MRSLRFGRLVSLLTCGWLLACVEPDETLLPSTFNVVVVEATLTNLAEAQLIRLNRSFSDPFTGRTSSLPLTNAIVEVLVDSAQVVVGHETIAGSYQLPADFKGQPGHAYQLRFQLSDGTQYASDTQLLPASPVPPIRRVSARFNAKSLSPALDGFFTAGHDLFVDFQDPADQHNYYRWDWKMWEKQAFCRSCYQGIYSIYAVQARLVITNSAQGNYYIYTSDNATLLEDCYKELAPPVYSKRSPVPEYRYDYYCRSQCWEILYSYDTKVFDDQFTNGGGISGLKIAQIPFYDHNPALVEVRQGLLSAGAYHYFKRFQDQTENTGGLADTPPSALAGNVHRTAHGQEQEVVVGYFTASAITTSRYWLDRKDAVGVSLGGSGPTGYDGPPGSELFYALNRRLPAQEPVPPTLPQVPLVNSPPRAPTAICVPSESRTPNKPEGWRD